MDRSTNRGREAVHRPARWLAALLALMLAACGGGGEGGFLVPEGAQLFRKPLPSLVQDTVPAGERVDVSADDFFAFAAGDRASYLGADRIFGSPLEVRREVTAGPDAQGVFTIVESVPSRPEWGTVDERWQRRADGWYSPDPLGANAPAGVRAQLDSVLLYPLPFHAPGSERVVLRQGPLGQDLDGDGRDESFRFELRQTFVGFETGTRGGRAERRAHFVNRVSLTVQPSDPRFLVIQLDLVEAAVFASHTGLISAVRRQQTNGPTRVEYDGPTLLLSGRLGGHDVDAAWNAGSVRYLPMKHFDLAYDPVRRLYYAGLAAADEGHPGSVARVDPFTGATAFSVPLGGDVSSIAVSADGNILYAGVDGVAELFQLSLPDLALVRRVPLPAGSWASGLAVSPVDPTLVALQVARYDILALMRNGAFLPAQLGLQQFRAVLSTDPVHFSPDGSALYAFDAAAGLVRMDVTAAGLAPPLRPLAGPVFGRTLTNSAAGLVAGHRLFAFGTDALLGGPADDSRLGDCVPLPNATRWVCRYDGLRNIVGVVDTAGFTLIPDGQVPLPNPQPTGRIVRMVPGPAGQVALMVSAEGVSSDQLALFDNPDFR